MSIKCPVVKWKAMILEERKGKKIEVPELTYSMNKELSSGTSLKNI
jgi:hypothetical protein